MRLRISYDAPRVCTDPMCRCAGRPQPADNFDIHKRADGTFSRDPRCVDCRRRYYRELYRVKLTSLVG